MADYNPDTDPRSSNSLIRAYLASKQMQPSNPNYAQAVRTALEQNSRSPGTIPGLVNSTPSTEAEDQAAMAAARAGRGGGAARTIPPVVSPTTIPSSTVSPTTVNTSDSSATGSGQTSAPPTADNKSGLSLGGMIAAGLGALGTGAGLGWYGANKYLRPDAVTGEPTASTAAIPGTGAVREAPINPFDLTGSATGGAANVPEAMRFEMTAQGPRASGVGQPTTQVAPDTGTAMQLSPAEPARSGGRVQPITQAESGTTVRLPATELPQAGTAPQMTSTPPNAPTELQLPGRVSNAEIGNAGGAAVGNMRDMLWNKFQSGQTTELGNPSNVLQAAQANKGNITDRASFDRFLDAWNTRLQGGGAVPNKVMDEAIAGTTPSPRAAELRARVRARPPRF